MFFLRFKIPNHFLLLLVIIPLISCVEKNNKHEERLAWAQGIYNAEYESYQNRIGIELVLQPNGKEKWTKVRIPELTKVQIATLKRKKIVLTETHRIIKTYRAIIKAEKIPTAEREQSLIHIIEKLKNIDIDF